MTRAARPRRIPRSSPRHLPSERWARIVAKIERPLVPFLRDDLPGCPPDLQRWFLEYLEHFRDELTGEIAEARATLEVQRP